MQIGTESHYEDLLPSSTFIQSIVSPDCLIYDFPAHFKISLHRQSRPALCECYGTYVYLLLDFLNVANIFSIAAAAEKGIEITRSLIDLAKIENGLSKELTV